MRKCDQCRENIWLAASSPQPDHLICVECFQEVERLDEQIFHPTSEQAADINAHTGVSSPAAE
jgi:hypothetical protein